MSRMNDYLYELATDRRRGVFACLVKPVLSILSLIYGLIVRILICLKRRNPVCLGCKVISVGNFTLGGTGKTTVVEYVARRLAADGHHVAILSRGRTGSQNLGDEPSMLSRKLAGIPVIIDTDRIRGARHAVEKYGVDTVILDDGLQQWHIKKDLEIITVDAGCPFGNGSLLPRGILRQPLSTLPPKPVFILTKANLYPQTQRARQTLSEAADLALVVEAAHQPVGFYELGRPEKLLALDSMNGQRAVLFCGIGDPASFENLVGDLGIKIVQSLRFCDHHHYTQADLEKIYAVAKEKNANVLITTEKDAARFHDKQCTAGDIKILVLRIELKFEYDGEQRFNNRLGVLYSF